MFELIDADEELVHEVGLENPTTYQSMTTLISLKMYGL